MGASGVEQPHAAELHAEPRRGAQLRVEQLSAHRWRNLESLTFKPSPHFNVIWGDNGAGKSNLLEAIHYLGSLRSFRSAKTDDLIGLGHHEATIRARIGGHLAPQTFAAGLARGRARKLTIGEKRPRSIAVWRRAIQMVLFHPGHLTLTLGSPEPRRHYLDRILEQMDITYSAALDAYTKALRSRNRLLKLERVDRRSVVAFDQILAESGTVIGQTRAALIEDLAPRAEQAFANVVGAKLPLSVRYAPRVQPEAEEILQKLAASYDKDRARGFTAEGPHADDLELRLNGVVAKHHASQGQHRAMVLALKVAELNTLSERLGNVPILLLDDVSSELDRGRNRRLFELLAGLGGQVFLTTTHREFILLEHDRVDFHVEAGQLK